MLPEEPGADPRAHRFDQGVAAVALTAAWVFQQRWVLPLWAVFLAISGFVGPRGAPFQMFFADVLAPRLHEGRHTEPARNLARESLVEAGVLALASVVAFATGVTGLAWLLGLAVAAAAAFSAATGIPPIGRLLGRSRPHRGG